MRIQDEKDPLIDYQIRTLPPAQNRHGWIDYHEVSKWTGGRVPETVYTVTQNRDNSRFTCDCPAAFRGKCKHIDFVKLYLDRGMPATFPTLERIDG